MRSMQSLSDTELIENFHGGDQRSFEALLGRYERDVRNVILHYVKERATVEDLSQDAFIKIYTSLKTGKYNEQGKFLPWALRITRNLCMDYLRRGVQHPVSGTLLHDNYVGTSTNQVENRLALRQREEQISTFINNLQEDQKKVIFYRYFEGLSFKQIATLMNTSVNTSVGRMRYGLMHLRRQVDNTPAYLWK